jgi:hypothetical protein
MSIKKCINCQTDLVGEYCHSCGEKVVSPKDFSFVKLAEQTVDVFTHLDSKLYKSFKLLIFRPGELSTHYVEGLRKPFMKPVQIFILVNVLFFILLSDVDIFRKPSPWWFQVTDDMGLNIKSIAERKATELSKPISEIALQYEQKSKSIAKAFVLIFIPLLGFIFSVLFLRKKMQIGKHFIFATHFFSFTLLVMVVWTELLRLLFAEVESLYYVIPIQAVLLVYLIFAIRQFYKVSWIYTVFTALVASILLNVLIEIYRSFVSYYSLISIH